MDLFKRPNSIIDLITSGVSPILPFNTSIQTVEEKIKLEPDADFFFDGMFIYFDSVRFTFQNDLLVEYNLEFFKLPQLRFPILIEDFEERDISNSTPMNRMIMLLNMLEIKYSNIHVSSIDYFILQTENRVNIYFDLNDGMLYRIGKLNSFI